MGTGIAMFITIAIFLTVQLIPKVPVPNVCQVIIYLPQTTHASNAEL